MLGKLMKHEFRATGRIGLPLCGLMLALSVVAGMMIRFSGNGKSYSWLDRAGSTVVILYALSVFAVSIGIFIVLMQHFKRNLLGDEGYLMRTLPVSIHELLLSKLFVAVIWYITAMLLIILSGLLAVLMSGEITVPDISELFSRLRAALAETTFGFWLHTFLSYIAGASLLTLLFYADFSMTQSFSKHRVLYNILAVVVFIVLLRLIFALNGFMDANIFGEQYVYSPQFPHSSSEFTVSRGSIFGLVELFVIDTLLYFLTWAFLKFKPNLE